MLLSNLSLPPLHFHCIPLHPLPVGFTLIRSQMADEETLDTIVKSVVRNDGQRAKVILDSLHGQGIAQLSDLGNLNANRLEETLDDAKIKPAKTRADLEDKLKEYIKKGTITHWNSLTTFARFSLSICYCSKWLVYFSRPPCQ